MFISIRSRYTIVVVEEVIKNMGVQHVIAGGRGDNQKLDEILKVLSGEATDFARDADPLMQRTVLAIVVL
jgi:hypothetical protein